MRLLLVEDDEPIAEVLAEALQDSGYVVDVVGDGESAWQQVSQEEYSLLLLDVMLPKLDGISLCRRMRSRGMNMPILTMTALDSSSDKVIALDAGADDYIVKPVDLPELLARIRALLRRTMAEASPILQWSQLQLNPQSHEVRYGDRPLSLTPKEFMMLELFMRSGDRVLSRRVILGHLWGYDDPPDEETVKAHIKGLRRKLRQAGAPSDFIETVRGVGYRLKQIA